MAPNNRKLREAVLAFPGWPSPSLTLTLRWDTPTPERRPCLAHGVVTSAFLRGALKNRCYSFSRAVILRGLTLFTTRVKSLTAEINGFYGRNIPRRLVVLRERAVSASRGVCSAVANWWHSAEPRDGRQPPRGRVRARPTPDYRPATPSSLLPRPRQASHLLVGWVGRSEPRHSFALSGGLFYRSLEMRRISDTIIRGGRDAPSSSTLQLVTASPWITLAIPPPTCLTNPPSPTSDTCAPHLTFNHRLSQIWPCLK
ncbi:hypothetical protein E2C01_044422 [Portunus trituberculatus]|uniref:Uncharacterized protein n=1 Tax=Portunus trituberculatus TaxID=210409 RepID=A0A5B7G006_PORTR|nr:hypothetical protein [Portunus trituberculatus]